ncbi:hypothetical protein NKI48_18065 [Mesorhizobium sp. M0644]|uniref:hypothetical protein n=1 Tax=unclassified Mesorhizobium TaxID=325217 RepID=UPI0033379399
MVAEYIDEFIMFCAGLRMAGVGFRFFADPFQARPGQQQAWWTNFGTRFKWMGPLLILIAIVLAFAAPS